MTSTILPRSLPPSRCRGQGVARPCGRPAGGPAGRVAGRLLPEQIDPSDGSFLGNFPQGLSHVGLLSSSVVLARIQRGIQPELSTEAWFRH
ncbi:hypothetical protein ACIBTP_37110 [Streptomyces avidinii]|uniref:hypothetical protein n=1 Tax=Streptomyces TaxID=1883 RepID=UPI0013DE37D8|nr:hypothetical protein [Streptomyces sp. ADI95-16]